MQVTEFAELIWHDQMEEVREALKDEGNLQPFRDYINTLFNNPSPNDEGVDIQLALAQRVLKILDNEGPLAEDAQKLACAAWEALPNSSVSTSFKGLATDLVKHGVDVASLAPNHEHPLFLAIEEGHWGMVHELLESKITELPMQDVEHLSLLTLAAHALFEALTPGVSKADPSRARWIRMIIEELTDAIPDEAFNIADSIDELSLWLLMHPDLEIEDSTLIKILSKLPDERLKEKSKDQMTLIHKAALLPGTSPDFFKALVERYQKDGLKPILSTHASKFGTVAQMMASFGFRPENLATLLRARFDEDQNSALDEELLSLAQSIARQGQLPDIHLLRSYTGGIGLALCCGMYDKARQIIHRCLAVDKGNTLSQLAARFGCLEWILQGAYLPEWFGLSPLHDNIEVKRQTEKLIAELLLDHPFHETWLANPDPEHSFLYLAAKNGWHSLAAQIWRKLSDRHIQAIRDQFWQMLDQAESAPLCTSVEERTYLLSQLWRNLPQLSQYDKEVFFRLIHYSDHAIRCVRNSRRGTFQPNDLVYLVKLQEGHELRLAIALNMQPEKIRDLTRTRKDYYKEAVAGLKSDLLAIPSKQWEPLMHYLAFVLNVEGKLSSLLSGAELQEVAWNVLNFNQNCRQALFPPILDKLKIDIKSLITPCTANIQRLLSGINHNSNLRRWLQSQLALACFTEYDRIPYVWWLASAAQRESFIRERLDCALDWAWQNESPSACSVLCKGLTYEHLAQLVPVQKLQQPNCADLSGLAEYPAILSTLCDQKRREATLDQFRESLQLALRFLVDQLPHVDEDLKREFSDTLSKVNTAWSTVNHAVTEEECAQLCRLPLLVLQQHVQSSLASADDHPEHISALEQVALDMELKRKLLATQRNLMESEVTSEMLAEFQPSREETEDYQRSACQATIEKLATQQGFLATAPANNPEALKAWFDPIYHMALVATTYLASSSTELALCDSEAERADMIEKRRQIACFLSWAGPFCGTRLHSAVRHSYMCAAKIPGYDSVETWLLSTLHSLRLDIASRLASRYGSHGENFVINSLVQKGFIQGEHLSTLDSTTLTPTSKQVDAWHRAAFDIYASEIDSYLFNALKTSAYAGAPAVEHLMDWWPSRMSKTYLHSFREQLTHLAEDCPMYAEKVLEDNGLFSPETSLGVRRALLNKLWEAEKQAELAKKPYARLRELAREKSNRVLVEANKEGIRLASIEGAEDEIEYAAKKAWMTNAELPKAYEEVLKELQSCNASACKEKLKSLEIEWDLHQAFDMLLDDNKWEGFRAQRWLAQGFSEDGTPSFRARVALLIYAGVMEVDEGFKDYLG